MEGVRLSGLIDPLQMLNVDFQSFDIPREVSVYFDRGYIRSWTKAWFNNREDGEPSVEIKLAEAIRFLQQNIDRDEWLQEYFPKQMENCRNAIAKTREQLLLNQLG